MLRFASLFAAVVIAVHGLIHLAGTAVYTRLRTIENLPYKTSLLGGRWDVGETGAFVFGVLWAVAALGFLGAAAAWLSGRPDWTAILLPVTLLSLVLTVLDSTVAKFGVFVNVAILVGLWLGPRALAKLLN